MSWGSFQERWIDHLVVHFQELSVSRIAAIRLPSTFPVPEYDTTSVLRVYLRLKAIFIQNKVRPQDGMVGLQLWQIKGMLDAYNEKFISTSDKLNEGYLNEITDEVMGIYCADEFSIDFIRTEEAEEEEEEHIVHKCTEHIHNIFSIKINVQKIKLLLSSGTPMAN
ncbi:unnamed protein product [Trichobilharzia regenti]|nr:unnamed protein product [Trichobilharzia regenti]